MVKDDGKTYISSKENICKNCGQTEDKHVGLLKFCNTDYEDNLNLKFEPQESKSSHTENGLNYCSGQVVRNEMRATEAGHGTGVDDTNSLTASKDICEAQEIVNWVKKNQCSVRSKFIPLSKHNEEIKIKEEGAFSYGQEREKQVWLSRINSIQEKAEKELKEHIEPITFKIGNPHYNEHCYICRELNAIIKTCKEIKGEK